VSVSEEPLRARRDTAPALVTFWAANGCYCAAASRFAAKTCQVPARPRRAIVLRLVTHACRALLMASSVSVPVISLVNLHAGRPPPPAPPTVG